MKITKRSGSIVLYDDEKITRSILRANAETTEELSEKGAAYLADAVLGRLVRKHDIITTELIREGVYEALMERELYLTARRYRDFSKEEGN